MQEVSRKRAKEPLVLAIDIGSSAIRGRVVDADGAIVKKLEARIRHKLQNSGGGAVTVDAGGMLAETERLIDMLLDKAGKHGGAIAGVALDTFASSLVGVDANGKPLTPVYTYADSQPAAQVRALQASMDERAVQQRTGCRFHSGYLPARLRWLAETSAALMHEVAFWLSLGEYLYLQFLGQRAVSFSTASWGGLLNRHTLNWDEDLLGVLPVQRSQLSPLHDTTEPLTGLTEAYAKRWPVLAKAHWFPAVADGFASNVGCGAIDASVLGLSVGTSGAVRVLLDGTPERIPDGLWCYRVDRRRSLLGGALNDGGRAIAWLRELLNLPAEAGLIAAAKAPPRSTTPVVLPFLTGERSPGWAVGAMASFSAMTAETTSVDLFRGTLEGVAFRLAAIAGEIRSAAPNVERIIASGGGVEGMVDWLQIIADTAGLPAALSLDGQATLAGTASIALDVLAPHRSKFPPATGESYKPNPHNTAVYAASRQRQEEAYAKLVAGR